MMTLNTMTSVSRRYLVRELLMDGLWHSTAEVCHPAVGGSEGCRRLRELRKSFRQEGYDILKRRKEGSTQYEYRMVRRPVDHHHV